MKHAARAIFSSLLLISVAFGGLRTASAEVAAQNPRPRVLEINKGDSIDSARFHIGASALRELTYRLFDEDGFRVHRSSDPIPPEGITCKGKKRLRRVEWEILPGKDDTTSVLSIECARFGNKSWADHAMDLVVEEISKHDPPPEAAVKNTEPETKPAEASPIKGPNYLDPRYEKGEKEDKNGDLVFPIEPLAISSANQKTPAESAPAKSSGEKAEALKEPSEDVFRGVQRGEVSEKDGAERISAYLQVLWLDAGRAPADELRKALSQQLAHALAERQLASKEAAGLVELLDGGVRPEHSDAQAAQRLIESVKAKLKATDLDDEPRAELSKTMSAIIGE